MFILHIDLGDFVYLLLFFLFLFSPLTLGSHLACTVFHLASFSRFFFFLLLLFIIPGLDRCCGLGSFAGGPTAEGYVAVFPCTISVLVYKTRQGYWKRIEEGEEESDTDALAVLREHLGWTQD